MRRRPNAASPTLLALAGLLSACQDDGARIAFGWERMIDQKKYDAFEAADFFPDGKVMRSPPDGTVLREAPVLTTEMRTGRTAGNTRGDTAVGRALPPPSSAADYVTRIPLPLEIADVRRGRDRFDIYCAVCHGIDGSGASRVAMSMSLRPPASLIAGRVRSFPPGRIFETISEGYGLMPSYAAELGVADRWRVVAYVRALQLAHRAPLDSLPAALRAEVVRKLTSPNTGPTDTAAAVRTRTEAR